LLALLAAHNLPGAEADSRQRTDAFLSLRQLNERMPPDLEAAHAGERAMIRGTVNSRAFRLRGYSILTIEDSAAGAALQMFGDDQQQLQAYQPGDEIEARGVVSMVDGMVVLVPDGISLLARTSPPQAIEVPSLPGADYLGRLVRVTGRIRHSASAASGVYLVLEQPGGAFNVFMPTGPDGSDGGFGAVRVGDDIEVTGVGFQYCTHPPFNRGYQVMVGSPAPVTEKPGTHGISPVFVLGFLALMALVGLFLWRREGRLRAQRERLRKIYQLGEEILGAPSAEAIFKRIEDALPPILDVNQVRLYLYNRGSKTLDGVSGDTGEAVSISLSTPPNGPPAGAVACFHYRTLLAIPDIDRSPFPVSGPAGVAAPKSLLFVPMLAQKEVVGVMELDQDDRPRDFSADEQAWAQHLGNQIAVSLRLLSRRSVQEQLFRTEKLAAVGRLISGIVNDLESPLSSIGELAEGALERARGGNLERDVSAIASEARKAASMVARLLSFASEDAAEARPVPISTLLRGLIDFREGDWKASGIRLRDLTSREPLQVLGSQGQLEQVFLNLLVHVEQSLADAPTKVLTIRTSVLARRLLVEIVFSGGREARDAEETAAVLGVTRSVIAGHGGEVRLIERLNEDPRFEIELPLAATDRTQTTVMPAAPHSDSVRRLTALAIEPDEAVLRQLVGLLAARGYRVVPAPDADNGLDMAQRMRFDVALCSVHAGGLNWVELAERLQSRVGVFILLSDRYDPELAADFEGNGRFVLAKPLQEAELIRCLRGIEKAAPAKIIRFKNGVA
jgi:GAF domain-containing protein/CheY-like chemotaxis protein